MILLAIAAAVSAEGAQADEPVAPERQAQAVVRILSAARIELGEGSQGGGQEAELRETQVRDGEISRPALLVEFS